MSISTKTKIQLHESLHRIHEKYRADMQPIPSRDNAQKWISHLIALLFPVSSVKLFNELDIMELELQLRHLLQPVENVISPVDEIISVFFNRIPGIFEELQKDAQGILSFDPAAHSIEEVFGIPRILCCGAYRFAHELYKLNIPVLPRLISEFAHSVTGIDINPGAVIGSGIFIDHGTGVVIGETCILGNNIKIYQGVTLGALNVSKAQAHVKRHPTIEDNVVIYSGTTILGGKTIIGHDSIIGGNVWLTESVPPYSLVYHKSEVRVRSNNDFDEGINFSI